MAHFLNPTHTRPLSAASGEGWAGSVESYRFMRIQVRMKDNHITDAAFGTTSCAPAIAAGDWVCDWVIGRKTDEALKLSADELREALGGLPESRSYCADLAVQALQAAVHHARAEGANT